jgi:hypothetical protein
MRRSITAMGSNFGSAACVGAAGGHPSCPGGFGRLDPAGLIGSANGEARDTAFGRLVLVDEVDPEGRDLGELHLVGITALLCAGQVAPDLVLESAPLGQLALVRRDVAADVGRQTSLDDHPQTFQVGDPSEVVHQSSPSFRKISCS